MSSTTYVVRSKYKSGAFPMQTEFRLGVTPPEKGIDTIGKTQAELVEREEATFEHNQTVILPTLEDLVKLGRIAQALLDGREPSSRNYDYKETS